MNTRILGTQEFKVSALGLGCMGMSYHRGPVPEQKAMIELLHQAVDLGITFFDTAEVYGPYTNEELLGRGLAQSKHITIATKFGFNIIDGKSTGLNSRPLQIRKVAEQSLKRLNREVIDLFYQHRPDPAVPIEDVAGAVRDLVSEGKVKHFGLCEVDAETVRKAHVVFPVTAVQSEYSLMWREPETDLFPTLEELKIGFVPYSPIGRAYLSGAIGENTRFSAENDNRASLPRFEAEAIKANQKLIYLLKEFGDARGLTTSQVALGWLLAKRDWIVPIPGTTKLNHLQENLAATNLKISSADWNSLEKSVDAITITGNRYPTDQQTKGTK